MRLDRRALAGVHGAFFIGSGLWPIVHMRSFEAVTGPKTSRWLVKTVGGLLASVGLGLGLAAKRNEVTASLALLAAGASATLGLSAFRYATAGRIAPIYLLDTLVEGALVSAWALTTVEPKLRSDPGRLREEDLPSPAKFRELGEDAPAGNYGSPDLAAYGEPDIGQD
jgi:hypothetical protein